MALSIDDLLAPMIDAAKFAVGQLGELWDAIASEATAQLAFLAEQIAGAARDLAAGDLTELEARTVIRGAKRTTISNIAKATILIKAKVKKIIKAAIDAVKSIVNTAVHALLVV